MKNLFHILWLAGGLALTAALPAQATVLLSTGFEDDEYYRLGALSGSEGWFSPGNTPNAFVQNNISRSGTQAVRVDSNVDPQLNLRYIGYDSATQADKGLRASIDVRIDQLGGYPTAWQVFALDSFRFTLDTPSNLLCVNGLCDYSMSSRAWHHLTLELDYANLASRFYLDGVLLTSGSLANQFANITSVSFGTLRTDDMESRTSSVYFDNLQVETFAAALAVPEPSALLLAGAGLLALVASRGLRGAGRSAADRN